MAIRSFFKDNVRRRSLFASKPTHAGLTILVGKCPVEARNGMTDGPSVDGQLLGVRNKRATDIVQARYRSQHMLNHALEILGAVPSTEKLGTSCILDKGLGPKSTLDFVRLARPVLTEWKLGWTSWFLCDDRALRRKIDVLRRADIRVIAGGTAGEIAFKRNCLDEYLHLCQSLGLDRVEFGECFAAEIPDLDALVSAARMHDLDVQFEIGRKNLNEDKQICTEERIDLAARWLDGGASQVVFEAREVGKGYAMFPESGGVDTGLIDRLRSRFSLDRLVFEAPTRDCQVALLKKLGPAVCLGNIDPTELLRVETFRRCIHADTLDCRESWIQDDATPD